MYTRIHGVGPALLAVVLLLLPVLYSPTVVAQPADPPSYRVLTDGTVHLKTGQRLAGRVSFSWGRGSTPHLTYVDGEDHRRTFKISNLISFTHGDRYVINHGIVTRDKRGNTVVVERLIERRVDGRLDLYAPLGEPEMAFPYTYFAKGDGPIREVNYGNLSEALQDDPRSARLVASSGRWRRLQYGMAITGGIALCAGLPTSMRFVLSNRVGPVSRTRFAFRPNGLLIAGTAAVVTGLIARHRKRVKFRQAVRTYIGSPPAAR